MTKEVTVAIAGARHYAGATAALAKLPAGFPLKLVREPENTHDRLAIAVMLAAERGMLRPQQLGYIPKGENVEMAWALASGVELVAAYAGGGRVTVRWGKVD